MEETKEFPLRVLLTVTTGRLLTVPEGPSDNEIGQLYEILGWMTNDSPFTYQLGRFAEECTPHLLKWFPELALAGMNSSLASLDKWIEDFSTASSHLGLVNGDASDGIRIWLTEMQLVHPEIRDTYMVPRIPKEAHDTSKTVIGELIEMTRHE